MFSLAKPYMSGVPVPRELSKELHAQAYRDHQYAMLTHNGIRETHRALVKTM